MLNEVKIRVLNENDLDAVVEIDKKVLGKERRAFWKRKIAYADVYPRPALVAELEALDAWLLALDAWLAAVLAELDELLAKLELLDAEFAAALAEFVADCASTIKSHLATSALELIGVVPVDVWVVLQRYTLLLEPSFTISLVFDLIDA